MARQRAPWAVALALSAWLPGSRALGQHPVDDAPRASSGMTVTAGAQITGVVRDRDTSLPVAGVTIQIVDGGQVAETGTNGRYVIAALTPGTHTLRCIRESYEPLNIVVTVDDGAQTVVDIGLVALPRVLPLVAVVAPQNKDSFDRRGATGPPVSDSPGSGGTTWSAEAIRRSSRIAQSDVLQVVATVPTVATRSEASSSLHVTGGSADQNLIMLDGIPIDNAVHAGDLTSAVDPAAIKAVTLYDGRMPASMGGRLASVIEISTRGHLLDARRDTNPIPRGRASLNIGGTVGTAGVGTSVAAMSPELNASGLFSVRHSPRGLGKMWFVDPEARQSPNDGWSDMLARGSIWLGRGELSVLGFATHDAMRFNGRGSRAARGANSPTGSPAAQLATPDEASSNQTPPPQQHGFFADTANGFAWRSSAMGISWRRPIGTQREFDLRAWQSNAATSGAWGVGVGRAAMTNRLVHSGAVAGITRTTPHTWVNAGVGLDMVRTVYAVNNTLSGADSVLPAQTSARAKIRLSGAPRLAHAFVDTRIGIAPWATASLGLRATSPLTRENPRGPAFRNITAPQFEPRLGLTLSPGARTTLEAAYARTEQYVQSLRNDESMFDNVIGLNLLSATGHGIPAATSDLASARVSVTMSPGVMVSTGAYARRLQHVVLAAPRATVPFVTDTFDIGSGRAKGWYVAAKRVTARMEADASFATIDVSRGTTQMRYRPGFAATKSLSFGIAARPFAHTTFRAAGLASDGRDAALTLGDFSWDWERGTGTSRSFQGTPRTALIGRSHLPPYLRFDLGARHDIMLGRHAGCDAMSSRSHPPADDGSTGAQSSLCPASNLALFASLNNVFDRTNTAGYVRNGMESSKGTGLQLLPRSVVAGLEWHR